MALSLNRLISLSEVHVNILLLLLDDDMVALAWALSAVPTCLPHKAASVGLHFVGKPR